MEDVGLRMCVCFFTGLQQGISCEGDLDINAKFPEAPSHTGVGSRCPGSTGTSAVRWVPGEMPLLPVEVEDSSTLPCPSTFGWENRAAGRVFPAAGWPLPLSQFVLSAGPSAGALPARE